MTGVDRTAESVRHRPGAGYSADFDVGPVVHHDAMTMEPGDGNDLDIPAQAPEVASGAIVVDESGLVVLGDSEFVDSYVSRLTALAKDAVSVVDVSKKSLADVAAAGASVAAVAANAGQYVKLSPASMELIKNSRLISGDPGYYLATTRQTSSSLFAGQVQWRPVSLNHAQLLNVQLAMVMIALRTAIASVEDAVDRVDRKVDAILKLAEADRTGAVVGMYQTLTRMTDHFDETGKLSQADWDSIATLGPGLDRLIAKLRSFVSKSLRDFEPEAPIGARADFLAAVVNQKLVGESLQLLVVAEDALYKWNRLKLARIEATEPDHIAATVESVNRALRDDLQSDAALLREARDVLDAFAAVRPLEFFRRSSAKSMRADADKLRVSLDDFASARRTQVADWADNEMPDFGDAVNEVKRLAKAGVEAAGETGIRAIDAGYSFAGSVGSFLQNAADRREKDRVGRPTKSGTDASGRMVEGDA